MYSHSNITKILMVVAVIAVVILGINKWNAKQQLQYENVVAAINEVASIVMESGGQEPERIVAALAPIYEVKIGVIERALDEIEDNGIGHFVAVEVLLLRVIELQPKAFVQTGIIRRPNQDKNYPWTFQDDTATLEAFEMKTQEPMKIKYLFETFSSQGRIKMAWK